MDEHINISSDERESLVRETSPDFPTYTTQILNLANRNAKSTRRSLVGPMKELVEEFHKEYPDGTYDDWVNFYMEEYDGERRIQSSVEELVEMLTNMREAMEKIDDEMAHDFIEELVLYKTYQGTNRDVKEVVLKKLSKIYQEDYRLSDDPEIDGFISDVPLNIKILEEDQETTNPNIPTIYVKGNRSNKSLEVNAEELSKTLDVTVSDGELFRRLG